MKEGVEPRETPAQAAREFPDLPDYVQIALTELVDDWVIEVDILAQRDDHLVCRIHTSSGKFILKSFRAQSPVKEILVYRMLGKYGVPILPCHGMTEVAILLADLDSYQEWQVADLHDMSEASTGTAIANWYRCLHKVGFDILGGRLENLDYLEPWVNLIQPGVLAELGEMLDVSNKLCWQQVIAHCEGLKAKYQSFPQTFNFNDFAAENLALSFTQAGQPQAVVFDYDQFSIGTIYRDWRNVCYSLQGEALTTFMDDYGEVSESEGLLDDVLSLLHGLIIAARREKFPGWALPLRNSIENGELGLKIALAMELL